jgi:hypothetical protein
MQSNNNKIILCSRYWYLSLISLGSPQNVINQTIVISLVWILRFIVLNWTEGGFQMIQ